MSWRFASQRNVIFQPLSYFRTGWSLLSVLLFPQNSFPGTIFWYVWIQELWACYEMLQIQTDNLTRNGIQIPGNRKLKRNRIGECRDKTKAEFRWETEERGDRKGGERRERDIRERLIKRRKACYIGERKWEQERETDRQTNTQRDRERLIKRKGLLGRDLVLSKRQCRKESVRNPRVIYGSVPSGFENLGSMDKIKI